MKKLYSLFLLSSAAVASAQTVNITFVVDMSQQSVNLAGELRCLGEEGRPRFHRTLENPELNVHGRITPRKSY